MWSIFAYTRFGNTSQTFLILSFTHLNTKFEGRVVWYFATMMPAQSFCLYNAKIMSNMFLYYFCLFYLILACLCHLLLLVGPVTDQIVQVVVRTVIKGVNPRTWCEGKWSWSLTTKGSFKSASTEMGWNGKLLLKWIKILIMLAAQCLHLPTASPIAAPQAWGGPHLPPHPVLFPYRHKHSRWTSHQGGCSNCHCFSCLPLS